MCHGGQISLAWTAPAATTPNLVAEPISAVQLKESQKSMLLRHGSGRGRTWAQICTQRLAPPGEICALRPAQPQA